MARDRVDSTSGIYKEPVSTTNREDNMPLINEISSSYCHYDIVYAKTTEGKGKVYNRTPEMIFRNVSAGDILNTYENFIINSKWDVRDSKTASSIVLARNNYFYEIFGNYETKINTVLETDDFEAKEYIKNEYESKKGNNDVFNIINSATDLIANKLKINQNYDIGTSMSAMKDKEHLKADRRNQDISVLDLLNRVGVRKYSENHFVISGVNLIYSEVSVNEEISNTLSMKYDNMFEEFNFITTILPVSNNEQFGENTVFEKQISPSSPQLESKTENKLRILEYLSSELFRELEYMYSGKIFCKYMEDIQIGDTVTLIDDVSSLTGKFRIDTFEHVLDSQGFRTILNVKACMDLVDPVLDLYNTEITLGLYSDLAHEIEKNEKNETGVNNYIKTIYNYYSKILLQGKRYCRIYHKKDKDAFDEIYTIVEDNVLANPMNIRVFPIYKKGKELMPESLKSAFYNLLPSAPESSLIKSIYKTLRQKVKILFRDLGNWATETLVYAGDFLISIPTFGFHELLKTPMGMTLKKAVENTYGKNTTQINGRQLEVLIGESDYDKWTISNKNKLTIGFFNVQAQKKENLINEVINDDYFKIDENKAYYPSDIFEKRRSVKEYNVKKIINDAFDITMLVELYDGFKDGEYTIDSFIENITPSNYEVSKKMQIFKNTYGSEYGVIISDPEKTKSLSMNTQVFSILDKAPIGLEGELERKYLETSLNVSDYNFGIDTLKIIWLHNLYGSSGLHEDVRTKNTRSIINKYNFEMAKDSKLGVIIMADLNLEVCNYNNSPIKNTGLKFYLNPSDNFVNRIKKCTTLDRNGEPKSNLYDNVLVSNNLNKIDVSNLMVQRFNYPYSDKKIVSDHLPVCISLEKKQ